MNKLNEQGMAAIEFRKEFLNPKYPELVHSSIGLAIEQTFEKSVVDKIKDLACTDKDFENFLLLEDSCRKTYEELLAEFDAIKEKLNLDAIDVETFSDVQADYISIKKEFRLQEKFLREYFYVESDAEFEKLMSRKGFIEKFAILRLKRIMHDFIESLDPAQVKLYTISNTPVFFNSEQQVYGIYMELKVDVDNLNDDAEIEAAHNDVQAILDASDEVFKAKMH
jgi:hypothetical protein